MFAKGDLQLITAVENHMFVFGGQVFPRDIDGKTFGTANLVKHIQGYLGIHNIPVRCRDRHGSLADRLCIIFNQQGRIKAVFDPQAFANRAGPVSRIK